MAAHKKKTCLEKLPIGVFDAGPGGLSVVKYMMTLLPEEDVLYLGDTARQPYGPQTTEKVRSNTLECCRWMVRQGVKAILIGCNTASVAALDAVHEEIPQIPILGMIEPGVRAALREPGSQKIGVWGTELTVNSHAYKQKLEGLNPKVEVIESVPVALLRLAEKGRIQDKVQIKLLVEEYLEPFQGFGMDSLIFGCTDLTCVREETESVLGNDVTIIDPAEEVVIEIRDWLRAQTCLNQQESTKRDYRICITGNDTQNFSSFTQAFLGIELSSVEQVDINYQEPKPVKGGTVFMESKLKVDSLQQRVYDRLKTNILTNKYAPGMAMNIDQLAGDLGVSQTPVREALAMLKHDGLVVTDYYKTPIVSMIEEDDVSEVYEVRKMLEGYAI
ncbi:MAG TPA: glutamate racemase, partial [Anaerolineaceae bacterium]|nr:glutamate racemase [Anaerolineaceae bacterium]